MALPSIVFFLAALPAVRSQVYTFNNWPAPEEYHLQGMLAFNVYSQKDAPCCSQQKPHVEFRDLRAAAPPGEASQVSQDKTYEALQVLLISKEMYKKRIEPLAACNEHNKLATEKCPGDVVAQTIPFTSAVEETVESHFELNTTGTYYLLLSNCGALKNATVTGTLAVRNSHGYLTAEEYHKKIAYGWYLIAYGILTFVWLVLLVQWQEEWVGLHFFVVAVLLAGLFESATWWMLLTVWNDSGEVVEKLRCFVIFLTVLRNYVACMMLLLVSLGWRLTLEELSNCKKVQIGVFGCVFLLLSMLREAAMAHRSAFQLSPKQMLTATLPSNLMMFLLFAWVFSALAGLIRTLQSKGSESQLRLMKRFTAIMCIVMLLAGAGSFAEFIVMSNTVPLPWSAQHFFSGGRSQVLTLITVTVAMIMWRPRADLGRAVKTTLDSCGAPATAAVAAFEEEKGLTTLDEEVVIVPTLEPHVIGAADEEDGNGKGSM